MAHQIAKRLLAAARVNRLVPPSTDATNIEMLSYSGGLAFTTVFAISLKDVTIRRCRSVRGGAMWVSNATFTLDNVSLIDNFATIGSALLYESRPTFLSTSTATGITAFNNSGVTIIKSFAPITWTCQAGAWMDEVGETTTNFEGCAQTCPVDYYYIGSDSTNCESCPFRSSSDSAAASIDDCYCTATYYAEDTGNQSTGTLTCNGCPVGVDCTAPGVKRSSLPVLRGYWRPDNQSIDVQRCPDVSSATSGCSVYGNNTCAPTLTGPFCMLCESTGYYFVPATSTAVATCSECGFPIITIIFAVFLVLLVVLVAVALLLFKRMKAKRASAARESSPAPSILSRMTPLLQVIASRQVQLKLLIGFYMIATKIDTVYDVSLPPHVKDILNIFSAPLSLGLTGLNGHFSCVVLGTGIGNYQAKLLFWAVAPLLVAVFIILGVFIGLPRAEKRCGRVLARASPWLLKAIFIMYPLITNAAFEAFPCYTFGTNGIEGEWLVADVAVSCGSEQYQTISAIAWTVIVIYPIGVLLVSSVLIIRARKAILLERRTELSEAISFLHKDYKPDYAWWEVMEIFRRFLLVGLFMVVARGNVMQILGATLYTALHFFLQVMAMPYASLANNFLASAINLCMLVFFITVCIVKYSNVINSDSSTWILLSSSEQRSLDISSVALSVVCLASVLGALAYAVVIFFIERAAARGAFDAMYRDLTTKLLNKKRFHLDAEKLEQRQIKSAFAVAAAELEADEESLTWSTEKKKKKKNVACVPTFLRVGAGADWKSADSAETAIRAEIYQAAFGSQDARGAMIARDDPKIRDIRNWKCSWSLDDEESMASLVAKLAENGGIVYISMDIQGFKAVNDNIDHTAGDDALYWYGKQLSATCVTWSRHGLVTRPYRTGGDELAVIVEAAKSVDTDNRRREFVAQVQSFVQELATITKDVGAEPGNTISDEKETTTSTSSEPRAQAEHLKPGLLVPDEAKAPAAAPTPALPIPRDPPPPSVYISTASPVSSYSSNGVMSDLSDRINELFSSKDAPETKSVNASPTAKQESEFEGTSGGTMQYLNA